MKITNTLKFVNFLTHEGFQKKGYNNLFCTGRTPLSYPNFYLSNKHEVVLTVRPLDLSNSVAYAYFAQTQYNVRRLGTQACQKNKWHLICITVNLII